ncbi:biopolymer transporter ExbD [Novosphingobium sp. TH158]|uniref:ExbD/TolR family protein n=1 Tax=Novosphingobium sp. TH158 TaxID=2067455 RepID=UPI000C7D07E3|nr:biopolymer transporter ExbD [Novosphingobium sp. TH158]PLK27453.1 protein TolR [Novosphingobium sp. TH158]
MGGGFSPGPGRRHSRRNGRAPMAEINVTPLVDVMLVLLAIFMVTAPLLAAGVKVELPESRAEALPQAAQQVTLTMTADGRMWLDQDELAPGELPDRLAQAVEASGGKPPQLTLRADKALPYGDVMVAMGEVNRAGVTSIALVTDSSVSAP